jgi:hypothetical protein
VNAEERADWVARRCATRTGHSLWGSPLIPLLALFAISAAVLGLLASRVRDWVVMTDELQYAKLATHIGETLSPLPTLRGMHYAAYAQLYPTLIAPFYGNMSSLGAFRAAHVANGVLFASVIFPVFLLARQRRLPSSWSVACAALAVVVPWNVSAAFVMTEAAAYPAFAWALCAIVWAIELPSPRRDAIALAALAVAAIARTQFLSLLVVFVVAALICGWRRHRVLWTSTAAGAVVVSVGRSHIFGNYATTAKGFPFPWRAFEQFGTHLGVVGVGTALLPLLIGGSWLVANVVRRNEFAVVALAAIAVLTLETSSYDVRYGGGLTEVRTRYLFYLAPPLLVAMVRALTEQRFHRRALAGVAAFVALTVLAHSFQRVPGFYGDAPDAVLNGFIRDAGGRWFVALAALAAALALIMVARPPYVFAIGVVAFVAASSVATSAIAWTRLLQSRGPSSREISAAPSVALDWADAALPPNAHVAIVPYASNALWEPNALLWWDVEFWNRDVERVYVIGSHWDYTPFGHQELRPDPKTGVIPGTEHAPEYVIVSESDARLGLQASGEVVARNGGLDILQVDRPYRAVWWSVGLDPDGWTRPGRRAWIHVVDNASVRVSLQRADGSSAPSACGRGIVPLPTTKTGTVASLPLGLVSGQTLRAVGARVTTVALVPSC